MMARSSRWSLLLVGTLALAWAWLVGSCGDVKLNGNEQAIIEAHLAPDADCKLDIHSRVVARGRYDSDSTGDPRLSSCARGYELNLRVHNLNDSPVVFSSAEITLADANDKPLVYPKSYKMKNPFESRLAAPVAGGALGVVTVLIVPYAFATASRQVNATVILHGEAESGEEVESRPFIYPIDVCNGCMNSCLSERVAAGEDITNAYHGMCNDDAGADDRVCIDPGC